jgi:hypothetical protein
LEIEAASDIIKLDTYYMGILMDALLLYQEADRVSMLTNPANYGTDNKKALSGTSCWSDYTNSNPITDMKTAIYQIRTKTGKYPNKLALGPDTLQTLQEHPKLIEKLKYSQLGVVTTDLISAMISPPENKIDVVLGTGLYKDPTSTDADPVFLNLWEDVALFAYVTQTAKANRSKYESTLGYTFSLSGYPYAGQETTEFQLTKKLGAFLCYDAKICKSSAGYLITNTVA